MVLINSLMSAAEGAAQTATSASESSPTVTFPNLGISIEEMANGFDVFGIHIAWYGVIIAVGMILAAVLVYNLARRTGQNADDYIDIFIATIIFGIIGARLYYVLFSWDYYSANPGEIINLRNGGLAIYGGIILGFLTVVVMCRIKKMSLLRVIDTCVPGVVIAQAIGRWGNFVNREAFGGFTDGLFAMQIKVSDAGGVISDELAKNIVTKNGVHYIQVHPTFLYESALCLVIFILIMIFRKKARYKGEVALWYFGAYGLGRFFIEELRTDSLMLADNIAVSQMLALILFVGSLAILVVMRIFISREPEAYPYVNLTVPGWKDLKFEKKNKNKANAESDDRTGDALQKENEEHGTQKEDDLLKDEEPDETSPAPAEDETGLNGAEDETESNEAEKPEADKAE